MLYPSFSAYQRRLRKDAVLPDGFEVGVGSLEFVPPERPNGGVQKMNLGLIRMLQPTASFAGVFSRNAFPGWPIVVGRELLESSQIQGVLVNNRVANVGVEGGLEASWRLSEFCSEIFGDSAPYFPSSTGVIGWALPLKEIEAALTDLKGNMSTGLILEFAKAIMTTDSWPKVRSHDCGAGRILGIAKGAGMVEPNMATALAFILTDVDFPRDVGRRIFLEVVDGSFNRISIDGETSTSDSVFLLSSCLHSYPGNDEFRNALMEVSFNLAEDVVRNGEGCAHVIRVSVAGASNTAEAHRLARAVANAPLSKLAIRGNDPNVGRILQSLGAECGRLGIGINPKKLELGIGGRTVFRNGAFHLGKKMEEFLHSYLKDSELPIPPHGWPIHEKKVEIEIALNMGMASASVIASDLSEEYVKINSDYRT
ncbi:Glutamate N-acetyltransferase @ N-acetylglutamate synthase [Olavius algarvensis spirochete endosymbiont]|uniref:bifunctional ornithine acetyltransferase/N-acetylglutamate synthase n=1 Tax=Olavius algarvensis spirochete endosymbiont TaxID=260710 RepID=UPI000F15FFD8|nr:bifunctional ornithine acetyltransferase/N-acetylglutamate synthase [Olavius algarvensis spirochete endosymbiont]VDA99496.1 Glutamate N-acetyltransferase @ N-acetylglutamate synthase [Olavius algarvensis spirochete endosymbiont]